MQFEGARPGGVLTFLGLAILSEVEATTALKLSAGFSRVVLSCVVVVGYVTAFFLLSQIAVVIAGVPALELGASR